MTCTFSPPQAKKFFTDSRKGQNLAKIPARATSWQGTGERRRAADNGCTRGSKEMASVQCGRAAHISRKRCAKYSRMTLARNCTDRNCARTRTINVSPSVDQMCSSSSPSRWTPLPCPSTKPSSRTDLRPLSARWDPAATTPAGIEKKYDIYFLFKNGPQLGS